MPYAMVPPGYRAVLVGQAGAIEELGSFAPLEESSAEGSLFLARLDFAGFPSSEDLSKLEEAFQSAGVERWPGYDYVVYADPGEPTVYLAWQKGFAWLPVIIGMVGATVLPPLLGSVAWWIIPDDLKNLLNSLVNMGVMLMMVFLMSKMMPAISPKKGKSKKVRQAEPEKLEEATK